MGWILSLGNNSFMAGCFYLLIAFAMIFFSASVKKIAEIEMWKNKSEKILYELNQSNIHQKNKDATFLVP